MFYHFIINVLVDIAMADSQDISEDELFSFSREILQRNRDHYWTFGLALGHTFKELDEQLNTCKDDRIRALMKGNYSQTHFP